MGAQSRPMWPRGRRWEGLGCQGVWRSQAWLDRARRRVTEGKGNLTECIAHLTFLSFVPPPAFSLLRFHSQEDKNQLFHCISRLCGSAGFGAGDALWRHRAGSGHLDLRGDVLPRPDIPRRPAHDSIDFSPVLHFSG